VRYNLSTLHIGWLCIRFRQTFLVLSTQVVRYIQLPPRMVSYSRLTEFLLHITSVKNIWIFPSCLCSNDFRTGRGLGHRLDCPFQWDGCTDRDKNTCVILSRDVTFTQSSVEPSSRLARPHIVPNRSRPGMTINPLFQNCYSLVPQGLLISQQTNTGWQHVFNDSTWSICGGSSCLVASASKSKDLPLVWRGKKTTNVWFK
jgi:hypothetical protein